MEDQKNQDPLDNPLHGISSKDNADSISYQQIQDPISKTLKTYIL